MGDSGFVVLGRTPSQRDFHVKYRSPQQEHNFGVPYQLGHEQHADSPSDAMLMSFPVREDCSWLQHVYQSRLHGRLRELCYVNGHLISFCETSSADAAIRTEHGRSPKTLSARVHQTLRASAAHHYWLFV